MLSGNDLYNINLCLMQVLKAIIAFVKDNYEMISSLVKQNYWSSKRDQFLAKEHLRIRSWVVIVKTA